MDCPTPDWPEDRNAEEEAAASEGEEAEGTGCEGVVVGAQDKEGPGCDRAEDKKLEDIGRSKEEDSTAAAAAATETAGGGEEVGAVVTMSTTTTEEDCTGIDRNTKDLVEEWAVLVVAETGGAGGG